MTQVKDTKLIAVIQTSFIGDAVLSLPFMERLLGSMSDDSKLLWIAAPRNIKIFDFALDRGLKEYKSKVQLVSFDKKNVSNPFKMKSFWRDLDFYPEIVFCLQRSFRTALFAWLSGAPQRIGFSSGSASFLYSDHVPRSWNLGYSEIEKNLDLLRKVFPDIQKWDTTNAKSLLAAGSTKTPDKRVVFSVGSPWPTKRWKTEHYVSLATKLCADGVEVVLSGDASAKAVADEIESKVESLLIKNKCAQTNIFEWVDMIADSSVLLSGDSAAIHVASDLDVPAVALFGPTVPEFGYAPWRRHSKALGVSHLDCRPCDIHGPKKCPKGHHKCMLDLQPDRVYREITRLLVDQEPNEG